MNIPKAARDIITTAREAGWQIRTTWQEDFDGVPFLNVDVWRLNPEVIAKLTWHSRGTGTLRLFHPLWTRDTITDDDGRIITRGWPWRDLPSLKKLRKVIEAEPWQT